MCGLSKGRVPLVQAMVGKRPFAWAMGDQAPIGWATGGRAPLVWAKSSGVAKHVTAPPVQSTGGRDGHLRNQMEAWHATIRGL